MAVKKNNNDFTRLPDEAAEQVEKKVAKQANFQEKSLSKAGRKKKSEEDKANNPRPVYFTQEQDEALEAYMTKTGVPFSTLVKQLLAEKNIL